MAVNEILVFPELDAVQDKDVKIEALEDDEMLLRADRILVNHHKSYEVDLAMYSDLFDTSIATMGVLFGW